MNAQEAEAKLRQVIRLKHFSHSTEDAYVHWLRRFMDYLSKLPWGLSA